MTHRNIAQTLRTGSLLITLIGQSPMVYAFDLSNPERPAQAEHAAVRVRRSITICELLRFNFDVKAKLYNSASDPIARESYRPIFKTLRI
jgi:hypothetical protein